MLVTWYFAPPWSDDGITWTDVPSKAWLGKAQQEHGMEHGKA